VHYKTEGPLDLEPEFFKYILEESASRVIRFRLCSLGEPFLNPNTPEMLRMAGERGIGCNVMTNGTIMGRDLADFLIGSTRTDMLTFSIDGAKAGTCEKLRRGLDFGKLLSNIAAVAEAKRRHKAHRPVIQANFVAMRDNAGELPDLVRLAAEIGIEDIDVNYLTTEGETDISGSLFRYPDLQKQAFREAHRITEEVGVVLHLPPDVTDGGFRARCTLPWDSMIIDTDGTARLCHYSWEEVVGNLRTDGGILAVWNNAVYREVRRTMDSETPAYRYCAHCAMRRGFSRIEAHMGKNNGNADIFRFAPKDTGAQPGRSRAQSGRST
jgi:MoaA/NifB/PqqE/SkfB family radical SAM enzyme